MWNSLDTIMAVAMGLISSRGVYPRYTPAERQLPAQAGPDTFLALDGYGTWALLSTSNEYEYERTFSVTVEVVYG